MDEVRSRLLETEALETLARAYVCDQAFPKKQTINPCVSFQTEKVQRSLCALVKFSGLDEEAAMSCPAAGFVLAFRQGDFLHIKQVRSFCITLFEALLFTEMLTVLRTVCQEYNKDWLIGRVVGPDTSLGFIPR